MHLILQTCVSLTIVALRFSNATFRFAIKHSKKTNEPISAVSPEVTYFVPLSPTVAVEIFHKDILKNDLAFFDIYQIKSIASYNKEIIKNCSRFLFSNKSFEALKCARDKINDET